MRAMDGEPERTGRYLQRLFVLPVIIRTGRAAPGLTPHRPVRQRITYNPPADNGKKTGLPTLFHSLPASRFSLCGYFPPVFPRFPAVPSNQPDNDRWSHGFRLPHHNRPQGHNCGKTAATRRRGSALSGQQYFSCRTGQSGSETGYALQLTEIPGRDYIHWRSPLFCRFSAW